MPALTNSAVVASSSAEYAKRAPPAFGSGSTFMLPFRPHGDFRRQVDAEGATIDGIEAAIGDAVGDPCVELFAQRILALGDANASDIGIEHDQRTNIEAGILGIDGG